MSQLRIKRSELYVHKTHDAIRGYINPSTEKGTKLPNNETIIGNQNQVLVKTNALAGGSFLGSENFR